MLYLLAAIAVTIVWQMPPATVSIYPCHSVASLHSSRAPPSNWFRTGLQAARACTEEAAFLPVHNGSVLVRPLSSVHALMCTDRRLTSGHAQAQYHFEHSQTSSRTEPGRRLLRLLERCQADSMDLAFTRGRWVCDLPDKHLLTGMASAAK